MTPFFSIVIPLFNKEKEIETTLKSVLNQTFQDFEVIVIDDGSTDNSKKIVESIGNSKIKLIATENSGISKARNRGIKEAIGELIAFVDADDFWFENHLEQLAELYKNYPKAGILACNYNIFYNKSKIIEPYFVGIPKGNWIGIVDDFFASSKINRIAWTGALAIPKKVLSKVGTFDETLVLNAAGEDTDLWIRIALDYPIAFNNSISAQYKKDASNRISEIITLNRNFPKLDKWLTIEKTNSSLKKFVDIYRIEYAIKYKVAGDIVTFQFYKNALNKNNLTLKNKLLFLLPSSILKIIYEIKKIMN